MTKSEAVKRAKTQKALAKLLGISPQAVSRWQADYIPPLQVYRLRELRPRWFRKAAP